MDCSMILCTYPAGPSQNQPQSLSPTGPAPLPRGWSAANQSSLLCAGYERRQAVLILCTDEAVAKFKNPEGFKLSELKLENHYSGTLDARHALQNIEKYQAKRAPYVIAMRFNDGGVLFASTGGHHSLQMHASEGSSYGDCILPRHTISTCICWKLAARLQRHKHAVSLQLPFCTLTTMPACTLGRSCG